MYKENKKDNNHKTELQWKPLHGYTLMNIIKPSPSLILGKLRYLMTSYILIGYTQGFHFYKYLFHVHCILSVDWKPWYKEYTIHHTKLLHLQRTLATLTYILLSHVIIVSGRQRVDLGLCPPPQPACRNDFIPSSRSVADVVQRPDNRSRLPLRLCRWDFPHRHSGFVGNVF